MTVLVRAKEKMYYNRREMQPGDTYEMDDRESSEINILCLLGKIERVTDDQAPKAPAPAAPAYQTTAAEPEPAAEDAGDAADEEAPARRRYYRRRDMRPEK